ncbi:hypothetical protein HK096_011145, partial [Nowakowskiella sp. JEL0078]
MSVVEIVDHSRSDVTDQGESDLGEDEAENDITRAEQNAIKQNKLQKSAHQCC